MELSTSTSPELELLQKIANEPPEEIAMFLDVATFDVLEKNRETKREFFKLFAQPLLAKIPLPRKDIRLGLEVDGEEYPDELHLNIEFKDFSTLLIIELEGLDQMTTADLLDENKKKEFFGIISNNIQKAMQNGKVTTTENGQMNFKMKMETKRQIIAQIAENLLKAA